MKTQRSRNVFGLMLMTGFGVNCTNSDPSAPATCKDAKAQYQVSTDGPQTLYVGGDKTMPWSAFCAGMASDSPKEFVELPRFSAQGDPANFSQFSEAALPTELVQSAAFQVTTHFEKVRIDPVDLTIDITNKAFIRSEITPAGADPVSAALDNVAIGYMPYATAMECGDVGSGSGSGAPVAANANLDLHDLPFELGEPQLCPGIGGSTVAADPTQPTKVVNFHALGTFTVNGTVTCGRSSVRCLPDPTANGQVGGHTAIHVRYVGTMARF